MSLISSITYMMNGQVFWALKPPPFWKHSGVIIEFDLTLSSFAVPVFRSQEVFDAKNWHHADHRATSQSCRKRDIYIYTEFSEAFDNPLRNFLLMDSIVGSERDFLSLLVHSHEKGCARVEGQMLHIKKDSRRICLS